MHVSTYHILIIKTILIVGENKNANGKQDLDQVIS